MAQDLTADEGKNSQLKQPSFYQEVPIVIILEYVEVKLSMTLCSYKEIHGYLIFLSQIHLHSTFVFAEKTARGSNYHDIFEIWLYTELREDSSNFAFQQYAPIHPIHWPLNVHVYLNKEIPH